LPALHRPTLHRPKLQRPSWPLSIRQTISVVLGLTLVVVTVAGLVLLIPNRPVATPGTGSVREVDFRAASKPPTGNFYYGPYFVSQGESLLMMGSDGKTSAVWSSTDGSTWEAISDPASFGAPNLRFVVLGFTTDGNGGLVAVGDGFAAGGKVAATAWHSRDGRTWTPAAVDFTTDTEMIGVAEQPGAIVSAGNGIAWFSRDGTSWNVVDLPDATGYMPRAVRAWAGGFAIVAVSGGTDPRHTAAWISPDGKTWTRAEGQLAGFEVQDLVAYGNGLVAVGSQILTPDEIATPSPSPSPTPAASASGKATPKPIKTVAPSPGISGASPSPAPTATPAPAVGEATSWISPDGLNWYRGNDLSAHQSQAFESVTQVFDSLVAVSSEPGSIMGASASSGPSASSGASASTAKAASLWTSDDGMTWKPMTTSASALTRGRLASFNKSLVLAGVDSNGSLAVLTGGVTLGSPLPLIEVTPTPAFSVSLHAGAMPLVPGLTADGTLGPVVATGDQFLAFVNGKAGATVLSSSDGNVWSTQAGPAVLMDATAAVTSTPAGATATPAGTLVTATPIVTGAKKTPVATAAAGTSAVTAAAPDGQGGIVAVGSVTLPSGQFPAIWRLTGATWTAATISGAAPSSLGSVAVHDGDFVAAADSSDGPRLLVSGDGASWVQAAISGADAYSLTVSTNSGGFIASGVDDSGKSAVWTSPDGLSWNTAGWKLPANAGVVYGTRKGLVTTSTGLTTNSSWWWSADGTTWQDSKLTTIGGCWGTLDSGFVAISQPSGPSAPSPSVVSGPSASVASGPSWTIWASRDARAWQQPISDPFSFGLSTTCRVASLQSKVIVVGWAKAGVLQDFYGVLTGF
jgi:hypothetical protein